MIPESAFPIYCFMCGSFLGDLGQFTRARSRHRRTSDSVCDGCYDQWEAANELAGLFYEGAVPLEERRQAYHACHRYHWRSGKALERSMLRVLGFEHVTLLDGVDLPDLTHYRTDWLNVDWSQAHRWSDGYWREVWRMERDHTSLAYRYYVLDWPLQERHVRTVEQAQARGRVLQWDILLLPWEGTTLPQGS